MSAGMDGGRRILLTYRNRLHNSESMNCSCHDVVSFSSGGQAHCVPRQRPGGSRREMCTGASHPKLGHMNVSWFRPLDERLWLITSSKRLPQPDFGACPNSPLGTPYLESSRN